MVFKSSPWRPGGNRFLASGAPSTSCVWRPESSPRRQWRRFFRKASPVVNLASARVKRGAAGPRGNRQRRRAWEGFARGNQQRRAQGPRAYTSRRDVSGEVADLGGQREKERAGGRRHLESSAATRRGCSNPACLLSNPMLQPLLQSICIFFLFSNQSGRIPSTPSPSKSSWLFFRLPASTPSRSCTGSSSSPLLSLCLVALSARLLAGLLVLGIGALLC